MAQMKEKRTYINYYVDKMDELESIEWYLRVGNDSVKYTFDEIQKQYVSIIQ